MIPRRVVIPVLVSQPGKPHAANGLFGAFCSAQEYVASPVGTASRSDDFAFGCGESDHERFCSALTLGQRGSSSPGFHESQSSAVQKRRADPLSRFIQRSTVKT
jgi:hypothetical protein